MDLRSFDTREASSAGVEVPLRDLNGQVVVSERDDEPIYFRLKGGDDPAVHAEILRQRKRPGKTPEEILAADLKLARLAVVGWSENVELDGKKLEFTPENRDMLFEIPLIRTVLHEVANRANFTKKR